MRLSRCLRAAARRKGRQLREDCRSLALKRRASGKVARQRFDGNGWRGKGSTVTPGTTELFDA
jgi:hypothetical protein